MKTKYLLYILMLLITVSGCGGSSSDPPATGTIKVGMTDASTTDYQAVYVTVKRVEVNKGGGDNWVTVSSPGKTYNLLDLVNGVREELALATLSTGHYTQMRLILSDEPEDALNILSLKHPYANYFVDLLGNCVELKVPSGYQSGIKIVKGFDISTNGTTELVLDFDATRSVVKAGRSGQYLLKPTIKIFATAEYCIVSGSAGQPGVLVSLQLYDSASSVSPENKVQIEAATVSDEDGNYKLFVAPGSYTLVAYKDGYSPYFKSSKVVTSAGYTYTENLSLTAASTGILEGGISIPGSDSEQYASISIRKTVVIDANSEQIELKFLNVADEGTFSTTLPTGNYNSVASTYDYTAVENTFSINSGVVTNIGTIAF